MRKRGAVLAHLATVAALGVSSCAHEERVAIDAPRGEITFDAGTAPDIAPEALQYVVADPAFSRAAPMVVMPLGKTGNGALLDGLRLIAGAGGARFAKEIAAPALVGADRLPGSMGGGFLFWNDRTLYTSESFDGALKPLAAMPDAIASVSFGPKALLVRGSNGERWSIDPRSGAPSPASPVGIVDVAALTDGRAAAVTEFGSTMITVDRGEHWIDVTAQLPGAAPGVLVAEDALWLKPLSGHVSRVDPGGTLTAFDKAPEVKPFVLRPKDPRWNANEAPIRRAIRLGLPLDEATALVVSDGNLVNVNLATGELVSVAPGRLPPDATCEALRAQDDVIVACTRPNGGASFVASHVFGDKAPLIEQTFTAPGVFYGSDDGSLAFGGPCTRAKASRLVTCVRSATGSWQEYDLENGDGGGPAVDVGRWVPRADGGAYGILTQPSVGTIDARTGEIHPWNMESVPAGARNFPEFRPHKKSDRETLRVIDRVWSATPQGTLRGWTDGGSAEVAVNGQIAVAAFGFERQAFSGPYALARTKEGRMWQTLDRGSSWTEVAAPLSTESDRFSEPRMCSAVGCDLGGWYRIGWVPTAPHVEARPTVAASAPILSAGTLPQIICKVTGDVRSTSAVRGPVSPEDLGLGASRIASNTDNTSYEFVRTLFARVPLNPPHGVDPGPSREEAAPRALFHGYSMSTNDAHLVVVGPVKDARALRRPVMFVSPFDPSGAVRRTSFGVSDVVSAARAIGLSAADVLGEDPTAVTGLTPLLETDPASPSDLAFFGAAGLVGVLRSGPVVRARVALRVRKSDESMPVSAVALGGDDTAMLELDPDGAEHVIKWTASGVADLFELPAPVSATLYPANPDALAVGPRGELGVLRTPSGGTPASVTDPALLLIPGSAAVPLASWSTLVSSDDPACRADPGGWRAIVQTVRPWVKIGGGGMHAEEDTPSFARVRWSQTRVCVEAIEVRVADVKTIAREVSSDRTTWTSPRDVESWVIARFTGAPSASRVAVSVGSEVRNALECTVARP